MPKNNNQTQTQQQQYQQYQSEKTKTRRQSTTPTKKNTPLQAAAKKPIIKRGRWEIEEKKAFLKGLRIYGRGKWKAIAKLIPQRYVILVVLCMYVM